MSSKSILSTYINNLLSILNETDVTEDEILKLKKIDRVELVNFYIANHLKRFHEHLKDYEVNFNNKRSHKAELNPINLEDYKSRLTQVLLANNVPPQQVAKIKVLKSKYSIEKFCRRRMPLLLLILIKHGFEEFKDHKKVKSIKTHVVKPKIQILYTPMGNKR